MTDMSVIDNDVKIYKADNQQLTQAYTDLFLLIFQSI